jgi:hypothetical protein
MGQSGSARYLRDIGKSGDTGGKQGEQPRQIGQSLDVGQIPDIPLQQAADIAAEPGVAPLSRVRGTPYSTIAISVLSSQREGQPFIFANYCIISFSFLSRPNIS